MLVIHIRVIYQNQTGSKDVQAHWAYVLVGQRG